MSRDSAASVLGLHYLPMSLLWDARHKWVKSLDETRMRADGNHLGQRHWESKLNKITTVLSTSFRKYFCLLGALHKRSKFANFLS